MCISWQELNKQQQSVAVNSWQELNKQQTNSQCAIIQRINYYYYYYGIIIISIQRNKQQQVQSPVRGPQKAQQLVQLVCCGCSIHHRLLGRLAHLQSTRAALVTVYRCTNDMLCTHEVHVATT